ncbi:hypothetical protein CS022_19580 [Veronia nyctiphanis]|uniref:DUF1223 domain-containing protein n=1 Tax=Veronia nyctiphanis TaxID=1278244 RepID=A0A4Q0YLV7_9GAMM|nr:DUF1223 domain-containing protein [Veronia nyctiphanis]RXJ71770.1 hypothetical protein CS022_19580 [Veronia nyctiphanis]
MNIREFCASISATLLLSLPVSAQTWVNNQAPATIVELFTSEGCSSCPSAEKKLNTLKEREELWTKVIPLAFHVDYWNYIGWKDRFSKREFSDRQRIKVAKRQAKGVYTPGWFINNQEWRGFFARHPIPFLSGSKAGELKATLENNQVTVNYDQPEEYSVNIALLAMDETTKVTRGENTGRKLDHDFVVVDFATYSGKQKWQHNLPQAMSAEPDAIAVWIESAGNRDPIQTVAGVIAK